MNGLIVYATTHGCTEKCAQTLSNQLQGSVTLNNLKKQSPRDLSSYDTIIVGGSIHAGNIQGKVKRFCESNTKILKEKRLGLFLCCMEEGETAQKQFDKAFPAELRAHAQAVGFFGGQFDLDKMNTIYKFITKKVAGVTENVSKIKEDNITAFAAEMNK
mgnify:CR=1 FL=1